MRRSVLMLTTVLALPVSSHGTSFSLLVESDADQPGGSEVFEASYDSLADFLSGTQAASGFSDLNITSDFSVGGFASDGDQYHLIFETDADQGPGSEVFLNIYNSLADFLSGALAASGFTSINVHSNFGVGGFASDGDQYHLILESDADQPGGSEVFLATYNSLADFLSGTAAASGFSAIGVGSTFGVGGFSGLVPIFTDGFESGDTSAWSSTQ